MSLIITQTKSKGVTAKPIKHSIAATQTAEPARRERDAAPIADKLLTGTGPRQTEGALKQLPQRHREDMFSEALLYLFSFYSRLHIIEKFEKESKRFD